mmetsp:Transcript_16988/g.2359  ORF Transcript_16988/g.2359 Transcript_16988/m.2359 type:complete len:84 (+) Transcript_16988:71-322(+)
MCPNRTTCANRHPEDKNYKDVDLRCFKYPECQEKEEKCNLIHAFRELCRRYPDCDKRDYNCSKLHPADGKYYKKALEKEKEVT